ncbi:hypothetical protein EN828_23295 [Mesorhizobium sp. M2D.F.Ca.ET.185.01.1.1]|uniref:hypothetical protein n=1 Tax=unclassified Mesorhizobium TaxID=325217 RepID=UPI000FCB84EE|nr:MULTISPECIES: hypothetical protein [unclassified Mesorhizobium]TGP77108.1 hypothetical protein EN870_21090 [bacterium M00.F.Ca.ET.227.01.1.1]TGP84477.1 hypothetical protein EN864_29805 [bacterium M00.F.Ca.ET.221.01.1.1]TGP88624.1 hypothetical protein EN865_26745 [bacterium M00.F.Ca.ET.222.01.1.1]TGT70778.1 hypothetical protein EN802_20880 [bacterium M00.F.Ca.ET.159.01.1.1]TGT82421.1 hypothetical protein EN800_19040 [bacterium M00.F.Ca.ET.157.01.1.1]TGU30855.1 hypothetical protein EN799_311
MYFLLFSFAAVAIPYGLERFYFVRRFGIFACIFWLFVLQFCSLFFGEIILERHVGQSLPDWIKSLGFAIGAFAYLTIGITPIAAIIAGSTAGIMIAAKSFRRENSG